MVWFYHSECLQERGVSGQRSSSVCTEHGKYFRIVCKIVKLIESSFDERDGVGSDLLDLSGSAEGGSD